MIAKAREKLMYQIGICDDEKDTCTEIEQWILEYGTKKHIDE